VIGEPGSAGGAGRVIGEEGSAGAGGPVTGQAAGGQAGAPPAPDSGLVDRDNPWPGLPSFREQDQEFFFGREAETEALRRTVMRESTRLTVLFGRSGLGKTSLLQAGLYPRLRRQQVLPVGIRLEYAGERSLVDQVRRAILDTAEAVHVEAPSFSAGETLWESFHRAGANFWDGNNRIVIPLLVFDQFEEVFTHGKSDPVRREAFFVELADLVEGRPPAAVKARLDADPPLAAEFSPERHDYRVLLSLRQDFLADLDGLRGRMRSLGASRLALLSMDGEAALRAVLRAGEHVIDAGVAEKVVRFVSGAGRGAGAELAGSVGDAEGAPAGLPGVPSAAASPEGAIADQEGNGRAAAPVPLKELEIDPTLLSLVCRALNNRRRQKGAPKITFDLLSGSWKEILARFYENSLAGLGPAVRAFVEDSLLTRSGYRDSVAWDNALSAPGVSAQDLQALCDRRLLRIEERNGKDRIELAHDVLTEVIGESRDLRRQREALLAAKAAERQALEREREASERERETHRLLERSRHFAIALTGALLLVVGLGVVGIRLAVQARRAERRAEQALFDSVGTLHATGRASEALAYLAWFLRSNPQGSLPARGRAIDILLANSWALPVLTVRHARGVNTAELSPDGARLLTACGDGTARLWSARDGAPLAVLRHGSPVFEASFSPDGTLVLTVSEDGTIRLWDGRSGAVIGSAMRQGSRLSWARFSPGSDRVVTNGLDGLLIWDVRTQQLLGRQAPVSSYSAGFSSDGKWLLVPQPDGSVARVELRSAVASRLLPGQPDGVLTAAFSHGGKLAVSADTAGVVRVWDLASVPRIVARLQVKGLVHWAEFSPDDRTILLWCSDDAARLWDFATPALPVRTLQHNNMVYGASFSPDGNRVLTASQGGAARLWDARSGEMLLEPMRDDGPVNAAVFSPDGRFAVTASDGGAAKLWELRVGHALPQRLGRPVEGARFGPRGYGVAAVTSDRAALLWDLATNRSVQATLGTRELLSVTYLANARPLLTTRESGGAIQVWDPLSGKPASGAIGYGKLPIAGAQASADGARVLVVRPQESTVDIWALQGGRRIAAVKSPGSKVAVNRDGTLILTSSRAAVRLWDARTGAPAAVIGTGGAASAEFGAGGQVVVTVARDFTLRTWDAASGRPLGAPMTLEGLPDATQLSLDRKRLVTVLQDSGEVKVWDVGAGKVICRLLIPGSAGTRAGFSARISPDGFRLLARSADNLAQLWDPETCRPLSESLQQPHPVTDAQFSADGASILTVSQDGLRVWTLPAGSAEDSAPLADLAEAVGGFTLDEEGAVVPVLDVAARLARLRAQGGRVEGEPPIARQIIRWFLAAPAARTISPFSRARVPDASFAVRQ
jgi:WD40 repeat protein